MTSLVIRPQLVCPALTHVHTHAMVGEQIWAKETVPEAVHACLISLPCYCTLAQGPSAWGLPTQQELLFLCRRQAGSERITLPSPGAALTSDWCEECKYSTPLPPLGWWPTACVLPIDAPSSPADLALGTRSEDQLDQAAFSSLPCPTPSSTGSWDHFPNKLHALESLSQGLLLGKPD